MEDKLIEYLSGFLTARRVELFDKILQNRTRYITVVLEDLYQPHNASAVLRSCECFGVQDVHIIENKNIYRISPDVALGSHKWLTLHRYNQKDTNTTDALLRLKEQGYRIVATTPVKNACPLDEFDLSAGKTALLFGSELNGLTPDAMELADEYLHIPMNGFTESLNISVTAAIMLHFLARQLRQHTSISWQLTIEEAREIKLKWLKTSIKKSDHIVTPFLDNLSRQENNPSPV
jgi:tRNA (guanosine-2'-O-)-methyltransferase